MRDLPVVTVTMKILQGSFLPDWSGSPYLDTVKNALMNSRGYRDCSPRHDQSSVGR